MILRRTLYRHINCVDCNCRIGKPYPGSTRTWESRSKAPRKNKPACDLRHIEDLAASCEHRRESFTVTCKRISATAHRYLERTSAETPSRARCASNWPARRYATFTGCGAWYSGEGSGLCGWRVALWRSYRRSKEGSAAKRVTRGGEDTLVRTTIGHWLLWNETLKVQCMPATSWTSTTVIPFIFRAKKLGYPSYCRA
jgi:hypothetical protein